MWPPLPKAFQGPAILRRTAPRGAARHRASMYSNNRVKALLYFTARRRALEYSRAFTLPSPQRPSALTRMFQTHLKASPLVAAPEAQPARHVGAVEHAGLVGQHAQNAHLGVQGKRESLQIGQVDNFVVSLIDLFAPIAALFYHWAGDLENLQIVFFTFHNIFKYWKILKIEEHGKYN